MFNNRNLRQQRTGVVCEVPEARLSVNGKTNSVLDLYFNTKHDCTVLYKVS